MSNDPVTVVTAFCKAWERRSVEDVLSYLAPDIVYQNVPRPAMHGIDETAKFLTPMLQNTIQIDFKLLSIALSPRGDEVLTERMDRLHYPTGIIDIPVMGIFVVRDGKISHWRDYADSAAVAAGFAKVNAAKSMGPATDRSADTAEYSADSTLSHAGRSSPEVPRDLAVPRGSSDFIG